jgi:hypothetical protein
MWKMRRELHVWFLECFELNSCFLILADHFLRWPRWNCKGQISLKKYKHSAMSVCFSLRTWLCWWNFPLHQRLSWVGDVILTSTGVWKFVMSGKIYKFCVVNFESLRVCLVELHKQKLCRRKPFWYQSRFGSFSKTCGCLGCLGCLGIMIIENHVFV